MYINKAIIYGNLTRDPELRAIPSGTQVCSFSVATNRTWKDKNGAKQESADFHNVVMFGRLAEIASQYLKKGRPVYVEGRIQTRSWDDKDGSGRKNYRTEIVADNFQFGPSAPGSGNFGGGQSSASSPKSSGSKAQTPQEEQAPVDSIEYPKEEINADDIPF